MRRELLEYAGDTTGAATLQNEVEKSTLLTVVMPVYNEVATVEQVIDRVMVLGSDVELVIVDDGSTDGTRELLSELDREGVKVVLHEKNQGKGAAVRTGDQHAGGEIVTIQDADLELNPDEIPSLLQPILEGTADVVYGSRFVYGWNHRN